jgi:TfoX/Sxy family transcriptional regulator of competence genes
MHHGGSWEKAPGDLVERFTAAVGDLPGATVRKMFGYPAGFTSGGHLFTGLFGSGWFVRLPDDARDELAAAGGAPFEPMAGRPMRGYLVMPPAMARDPAAAMPWVRRALEHAQQLPAKTKR